MLRCRCISGRMRSGVLLLLGKGEDEQVLVEAPLSVKAIVSEGTLISYDHDLMVV